MPGSMLEVLTWELHLKTRHEYVRRSRRRMTGVERELKKRGMPGP